ncbi:hypothetical protein RclHR1_09110004 [Rhizophagus clarus]|uniref:S-adenosyl-L-methionine-dependent methyltransferase n=1 Tax=Rhizophagus clarus TaxID=94130 RepID=A0A2Z6SPN4_9GLOM|nr:hypothetical protein RclHR1_09110004 [Rhizophagus clarus]GES97752.1 S-adenosyl-L-methionine-dependent methyltransferase [Rhizophagus clarus]
MGINNSKLLKSKKSKSKQIPSHDLLNKEKESTYYLSNDINDVDRLHIHHFFKKFIFQNNFSSPIEDKLIKGDCKVLDVGCGPGTWLLELSNTYTNSQFFGFDMTPIYPQEIKPNNLNFIEGNIFNGLPFSDNEFDFVHMESMTLIFTRDQWNFVLSELIRVTKSGGFIEVVEPYIISDEAGPIFKKLHGGIYNSSLKRNVDMKLIRNLDSIFESHSNIRKVHRDERKTIIGPNGDKIGSVYQQIFVSFCTTEMAIESLSNELGISEEKFRIMAEYDVIEEFKQKKPEVDHIRFWTQKI